MITCRTHRARHARLLRLPSARAGLVAVVVAAAGTAIAVPAGGAPAAIAVPSLTVLLLAGYVRRHRSRLGLEVRLARALLRTRGRCTRVDTVAGLDAEVEMAVRGDGTTAISARTWPDAVVAMGYACARDRGGQLETIRRAAAGRLAEVWGRPARAADRRYRTLDLAAAAESAFESLEPPERQTLVAYARGVNEAWRLHGPPFESRFLGYRPEPWRPADCILVGLYLFHAMSWNEPAKRAAAVIRRVLPADVADFFLTEEHTGPRTPPPALAGLRRDATGHAGLVTVEAPAPGSNCWAARTETGPLLACDLHLPLAMPNILYEVDLSWSGRRTRGVCVPGMPTILIGANDRLAWGVTNLCGDVLDIVPAERAGRAWREAPTATRRIRVRRRPDEPVEVKRAGDLVRSPDPLLGEAVAVRWTGYHPRAWDLRFQRLARARGTEEATGLLRTSQGVALNVLLADADGELAHLVTGLLPRRPRGSAGGPGDGYLDPGERPVSTAAPLVSANDDAFAEHPCRYGFDLDPGFRAARIRTALAENAPADAQDASDLQHDTAADLYGHYRDLALRALTDRDAGVRELLTAWNGRADAGSRAFGLLALFRRILAERVLGPYLVTCREAEPAFAYGLRALDEPLLGIVRAADPGLLPPGTEAAGWESFVRGCLFDAMARLRSATRTGRLPRWGRLNAFELAHPLVAVAPWAARLLSLRVRGQSGGTHTVRVCVPGFGAAVRAVFRPGRPGEARIDLPGGQSGHPLSVHYADRHRRWLRTAPGAPRDRDVRCEYTLRPAARTPAPDTGRTITHQA